MGRTTQYDVGAVCHRGFDRKCIFTNWRPLRIHAAPT